MRARFVRARTRSQFPGMSFSWDDGDSGVQLRVFGWLILVLFIPLLGMLIYFIARPDEFVVDDALV